MFKGFDEWDVPVGDGVLLHGRSGGTGEPLVLLHGHPRTHTTWWQVAPLLAAGGYRVICPDLRGYGRSSKPATTADHAPYSKRAVARDIVELMRSFGYGRFAVLGHDRGSYVAFRLAMDRPDVVTAAALLDCVPIGTALDLADARFAQLWWHWFFLAQPGKPERAILADPDAWYGGELELMGAGNFADYHRAIHDPATVAAMLEDYRAGLGVDRAADDADRSARRRLSCPTLVAWSTQDDMPALYGDITRIWEPWAPNLHSALIDSGHHMAELAPNELALVLLAFLRDRREE
jgi:haloacetate dehalogenase